MKIEQLKKVEKFRKIIKKDSTLIGFREGTFSKKFYDMLCSDVSTEEILTTLKDDEKVYYYTRSFAGAISKKLGLVVTEKKEDDLNEARKEAVENLVTQEISMVPATKVDMTQYIPLQNGYISRGLYGTTDVKLIGQLYENRSFTLLVGETGCGKTHLIRHFAYSKKLPYMRVNMNGATTPEDLAGQWIPNPNTDSDAKYIWRDGVLTQFMRYGGVFVVDELNMTPADILSMFHSVTDDERRLVLTQKDGEVITAHPDFWFIATMNPDYEGTRPLNLALKDRFRKIPLDYSSAVEKKLNISTKMLEVCEKLRSSEEIMTPTSTRDLIYYRDDTKFYGERIAREFFINNFEESERNVVKEVLELIIDGKVKEKKKEEEENKEVGA